MHPTRILVVDDEKNIRTTLSMCLEGMGAHCVAVGSSAAASDAVARSVFDMAFVDLKLGTESGLEVIPRLLAANPEMAIVIITAYATIDTAVEAMKRGARDYVPKPFTPTQIRHVVEKAQERRMLAARVTELEEQLATAAPEATLETESPTMRAVLEMVGRVAPTNASVLLRGENGTGKGVLARAVHAQSPRHMHPFVVVNCPTLSDELLASELFGHARGAFTGAIKDQPGRVESAEGGTLFLDEIGEIPPALQAKLLRFLQEKQFERVGENRTRHAEVRIIAATNRDLDADVKLGRFREDLFYRLSVIELRVPPLRERREDILPLARRFLSFFARAARRPAPELARETEQALQAYGWPGNVRELRNAIERAAIMWPGQLLEPQALPERIVKRGDGGPVLGGDFTIEQIEREHILQVCARTRTREDATNILGIDASTLFRKRRKYEEQ